MRSIPIIRWTRGSSCVLALVHGPGRGQSDLLQVLALERVDRAKNMARFYVLSIEPTLFEDLALVRRWGRIGSAGRERIDLHPSRPIAQIELKKWLDRKRRRGYRLRA